jgi:hypothetical protein
MIEHKGVEAALKVYGNADLTALVRADERFQKYF